MLAAACNGILKSKPSGTLSENKMVDVLVDLHLAEATIRLGNDTTIRSQDTINLRIRFAQVFRKNDVKPDEFNTSLNYYIKHIEQLDKIYVEVINRLTVMEAKLLEKPVNQGFNLVSRQPGVRPGPPLANPWYKSLTNTGEPEEIQYFDSVKYPVSPNE